MNHKETTSNAGEVVQKLEESSWPVNQQVVKWPGTSLFRSMQSDESNPRILFGQLVSIISLVITITGPALLLTAALNSLRIFEFVVLGQALSGSFGVMLFIFSVNEVSGTTPITPRASQRHQTGLKTAA